ncbi:hypothetical protein CBR_g78190 [Chara braunii]|uniref:FAS1 domain-containing protein n=1 Tax=Chara braunii TaxID=69332 RepID=A0A388JKD1_CHABU|nr:hypothetical protein CBR_g78190 [Chara braunii]|eukprot:GBG44729.1 hypothetical protein CBR_g78190 [Chara braunii]
MKAAAMAALLKTRKTALCLCLVGLSTLILATTSVTAQEEPIAVATASASAPAAGASDEFVAAVVSNPDLSLLTKSLQDTGLDGPLSELVASGVTVFAPTNASFLSLGSRLLECLTTEPGRSEILRPILLHHVLMGKFTAESLTTMGTAFLDSLYGSRLLILQAVADGTVRVDNANVIAADAISSTTSVAHVIDAVLVPAEVIPDIRRICLV